jgi:hypothetical protein
MARFRAAVLHEDPELLRVLAPDLRGLALSVTLPAARVEAAPA